MNIQIVIEDNEVYLYSQNGGRIMSLGQSFNTDDNIKRVVLRAMEYGRQIGLGEVRKAIGL